MNLGKSLCQSTRASVDFKAVIEWVLFGLLSVLATTCGGGGKGITDSIQPQASGWNLQLFAGVIPGPGFADGDGSAAILNYPKAIAATSSGDFYFIDGAEGRAMMVGVTGSVRKITPNGKITTIAGWPIGPKLAAKGITIDSKDNCYITVGQDVYKITPSGSISTYLHWDYARELNEIVCDKNDVLYIIAENTILRVSKDGSAKVLLSGLAIGPNGGPVGLAVTPLGDILFFEPTIGYGGTHYLKALKSNGSVSLFDWTGTGGPLNPSYPSSLVCAPDGTIYASDILGMVYRHQSSGASSVFLGQGGAGFQDGEGQNVVFGSIDGLCVDSFGNLCISDGRNNAIRISTPEGLVGTLAGCSPWKGQVDGQRTSARFGRYEGCLSYTMIGNIFYGPGDSLFLIDGIKVRRIDQEGSVTTLYSGSDLANHYPRSLAFDSNGKMYLAVSDETILLVSPDGASSVFAGTPNSMEQKDGPRLQAKFRGLGGMIVSNNILYVGDSGFIRTISLATGEVGTLAGSTNPLGVEPKDGTGSEAIIGGATSLVAGSDGNVYFIDSSMIRKLTPSGVVVTIAGNFTGGYRDGIGKQAMFLIPNQICFDNNGNLLVVEALNGVIRKIDTQGQVSTIFGMPPSFILALGVSSNLTDGGKLTRCNGITVAKNGDIFLSVSHGILKMKKDI